MANQERQAAIVGVHEYPLRVAPGVSAIQIQTESIKAALDDAGWLRHRRIVPISLCSDLEHVEHVGRRGRRVDDGDTHAYGMGNP